MQYPPGPDTWVSGFFFLPYVFWQRKFQQMEKQGVRLAMGFQKIQILIEIKWAAVPSPH